MRLPFDRALPAASPTRPRGVAGQWALRRALGAAAALVACLGIAAAGNAAPGIAAPGNAAPIKAIGVESEYADVIAQVGGAYVQVQAIETDPNTDPHSFEVSPRVAGLIASAQLLVENGLGYDSWVDRIMSAAPDKDRQVIDAQHRLGLPDSTLNPHLWYDPRTMPVVAKAIADRLGALQPEHAAYFQARLKAFDESLGPWISAIAAFKARTPHVPVAVTEPVANFLLQAAGFDILTPYSLQAAIMNGTDPSPQAVTAQNDLFDRHLVKLFVYNQQVTDTLTQSFLALARKDGIPVVGVYETMPAPGYHYQSWMIAELEALQRAVSDRTSTETLEMRR